MNNFRFLGLIFVISFFATAQANQIDMLAHGLADIAVQKELPTLLGQPISLENHESLEKFFVKENSKLIQDWIEQVSKQKDAEEIFERVLWPKDLDYSYLVLAYKGGLFEVAKNLIEKAPDIVVQQVQRGKSNKILLFELVKNFANPFDWSEYNDPLVSENKPLWQKTADQKVEIMLMVINKSNEEQLLTFEDPKVNLYPTALYKAVNKNCLPIIKPLLLKAPALIDPNLYGEDDEGENEVLIKAFNNYRDLQSYGQLGLLNKEIIDNRKNIMCQMIQYSAINDKERYEKLLSTLFFQVFNQGVLVIDTLLTNESFNDQFFDGLYEIFVTIVNKEPMILKNRLVDLLQYFFDANIEAQKRAQRFLKYAVNEFNRLYGKEDLKFAIQKKQTRLTERGLKEGSFYTLEEILKETGLEILQ